MGARFKWLTESHSPRLRTATESATEVSCCLEPHPCEVIRGNNVIVLSPIPSTSRKERREREKWTVHNV